MSQDDEDESCEAEGLEAHGGSGGAAADEGSRHYNRPMLAREAKEGRCGRSTISGLNKYRSAYLPRLPSNALLKVYPLVG